MLTSFWPPGIIVIVLLTPVVFTFASNVNFHALSFPFVSLMAKKRGTEEIATWIQFEVISIDLYFVFIEKLSHDGRVADSSSLDVTQYVSSLRLWFYRKVWAYGVITPVFLPPVEWILTNEIFSRFVKHTIPLGFCHFDLQTTFLPDYGLYFPCFDIRKGKIYLLSKTSRPVLGPPRPQILCIMVLFWCKLAWVWSWSFIFI